MTPPGKIHYSERHVNDVHPRGRCGLNGRLTHNLNEVTCQVCKFGVLSDVAPWARPFLDELRSKARAGESNAVIVPGAATEPMDSKVKGLGNGFARALSQQRSAEKAIRELFAAFPPLRRAVEKVVDNSGATTDPVGVQERQVAEDAGNTGEISQEALRDLQAAKGWVTPD